MSRGDWLRDVAVAVIVFALLFLGLGGALVIERIRGQPETRASEAGAGQRQEGAQSLPLRENQDQNASVQSNPCGEAERTENPDLCQQWRMAEAAENTVRVGMLQAILTVGALVATAIAAWAAVIAARAARHSATIAEREMTEARRPRIFASIADLHLSLQNDDKIRVAIENVGPLPAVVEAYRIKLVIAPYRDPPKPKVAFDPLMTENRLFPQVLRPSSAVEISMGHNITQQQLSGASADDGLHLIGLIRYRDHLWRTRLTGFCFVIEPGALGTRAIYYLAIGDDLNFEGEAMPA